jgi:hypothetical protein
MRFSSTPSAFEQGLVIAFLVTMAALFGWRYYDRESARTDARLAGEDFAQARALLEQKTVESASAAARRETVGPAGLNFSAPGPAAILSALRERLGPVKIRRCRYAPATAESAARLDLLVAGRSRDELVAAIARLGESPFADPIVGSISGDAEAELRVTVNS